MICDSTEVRQIFGSDGASTPCRMDNRFKLFMLDHLVINSNSVSLYKKGTVESSALISNRDLLSTVHLALDHRGQINWVHAKASVRAVSAGANSWFVPLKKSKYVGETNGRSIWTKVLNEASKKQVGVSPGRTTNVQLFRIIETLRIHGTSIGIFLLVLAWWRAHGELFHRLLSPSVSLITALLPVSPGTFRG
jgi:hypothetical protein